MLRISLVYLIVYFSLLSSQVGWGEIRRTSQWCGQQFTYLDQSCDTCFHVSDGEFYATAELKPNQESDSGSETSGQNTLTMYFYLKNAHGRSEALSGKEQFQRALAHFEGRFDRIRADWLTPGGKEKLSDNLAELNRLTLGKSSKSIEEAALGTWTGRQAVAAGFTEAEVVLAIGSPGAYKRVAVIFHRPPH